MEGGIDIAIHIIGQFSRVGLIGIKCDGG